MMVLMGRRGSGGLGRGRKVQRKNLSTNIHPDGIVWVMG